MNDELMLIAEKDVIEEDVLSIATEIVRGVS